MCRKHNRTLVNNEFALQRKHLLIQAHTIDILTHLLKAQ